MGLWQIDFTVQFTIYLLNEENNLNIFAEVQTFIKTDMLKQKEKLITTHCHKVAISKYNIINKKDY